MKNYFCKQTKIATKLNAPVTLTLLVSRAAWIFLAQVATTEISASGGEPALIGRPIRPTNGCLTVVERTMKARAAVNNMMLAKTRKETCIPYLSSLL